MRRSELITNKIDLLTISIYAVMLIAGWLNIYASIYTDDLSIFSLSNNAGKQLIFIGLAFLVIIVISVVDDKLFESLAIPIWIFFVLMLILVLLVAREVNGAKSWIEIGSFRFQPAEFAKFATALAVAAYASRPSFNPKNLKSVAIVSLIVGIPAILIIIQGDMGTALVMSIFVLVLFREGTSSLPLILGASAATIFLLALLVETHLYLWIGIATITGVLIFFNRKNKKRIISVLVLAFAVTAMLESVEYAFSNFLQPHQQSRILVLLNPNSDPLGAGWNVTQSKIAIGSGGFSGKGFLEGTQTTYDFVPEQSTDFIFCTIGEEQGWVGSLVLIVLFVTLLLRIIYIAERQKWKFVRIYGYSVAGILFFHFAVNIGMTIGLFPVIGIPLPFFSYGGSSLISFTILLFILLRLDSNRMQRLDH